MGVGERDVLYMLVKSIWGESLEPLLPSYLQIGWPGHEHELELDYYHYYFYLCYYLCYFLCYYCW